jgi:hypothetical protein
MFDHSNFSGVLSSNKNITFKDQPGYKKNKTIDLDNLNNMKSS